MSFADSINSGFGRLQNALFPANPSYGVDPNVQQTAQGNALFQLGLGLLSGQNAAQAFGGASQNYAGAMDNAFRHTLLKRQADYEQQQHDRQAKQQQQQDRQDAAVTAGRILKGLAANAANPQAYWGMVGNQPDVQDALKTLGVQAPYMGPMADPAKVQAFQQQLTNAAQVNAAPAAPIKLGAGEVLGTVTPDNQFTQIASAAPKSTVEWKDDGKQLVPRDSVTGQPVPGLAPIPKQLTPDQSRQSFTDQSSQLLASLAAKGVALPVGLRSKEQMTSTLNGLIAKYPSFTPDQIADQIAGGQIDFGAAKKETTTAAAQAGRVAIATNELNTFAPLVLQASAAVPRGSFLPVNKLLQIGETQISDPNLKQLKIAVTSMLNAYDQLAARGGTDMKKREEAHSLLTTADSPEALSAAVAMFQKEAQAAGDAAAAATEYRKPGEAPKATAPVDAINALIANPALRDQFQSKYGYLPAGF
jgi:hypothetical protein